LYRDNNNYYHFIPGLNFALICFQLLSGLVLMIMFNIDTRSLLATRNATWCWLTIIPLHATALCLLLVFYQCFHLWKNAGVCVGFKYIASPEIENAVSQHKFRGHWVTAIKKDEIKLTDKTNIDIEKVCTFLRTH
jgi:hypothetical protein